MTNREAALHYAGHGWRVFRIRPGSKLPQDRWVHGGPDEAATTDLAEVERRWAESPDANVGIATGQGLAVLDIDTNHGGARPDWAPETLAIRTPNGGFHLYYEVDGVVPNSAGQLAPGVDVRGDGGMVVAPPSTVDGGSYTAITGGPLTKIDPRLLTPNRQGARGPVLQRTSYGEGERHGAMLALAGKMRSWGCEYPEIIAALSALNDTRFQPRLEDEWVEKVARSIVRYAPDHELVRS